MKRLVYLLEDDQFLVSALFEELSDLECEVEIIPDVSSLVAKAGRAPNFIICDLFIPSGTLRIGTGTTRHAGSGVDALRRAKRKWPTSRLALITGMPSLDAQKWCEENNATYLVKPIGRGTLERLLGLRKLRAFVVHGRNEKDRKKAVSALQRTSIEPVVLIVQPSRGRTVIEKFEAVADTCDVAVVVWSPDDFGGLISTIKKAQHRTRQNVVFELGYFYGALRRRSGRVVLLEFGETELPSDMSGVIRIDATKPIKDISAYLKKEFGHLLD